MNENPKIYIVGIEGAGTSALAQIYKSLGYEVQGSDINDHYYWEILKNAGIKVFHEFNAENLPEDIEFAVYGSTFKDDNCEIMELRKRNVKLLSYAQALGELFKKKLGISICGTHGKTTTTAMMASVLKEIGLDPLALVGSNVIEWDNNVLLGKGDYFVVESDEYQNKLKYYNPWSVVLTSVDWDHPDFFPDFEIYKQAFKDFVEKVPKIGNLVVWGDSVSTLEVARHATCNILTYGFGEDCAYKVVNHRLETRENIALQSFDIYFKDKSLGTFQTPLSGKHNVLNATSVIALCHTMNLDLEKVKVALGKFRGTTRRFEMVGRFNEAILIDDYGHHPDEVKVTLNGARARFGSKKIWTVFHPHTFTRTKALLQDFAQSFDDTDHVIVLDVYGSAREKEGGVSSVDLVNLINKYQNNKAEHIPSIKQAVEYLKENSGEFEVLITMGAGDVWRVGQELKNNQ